MRRFSRLIIFMTSVGLFVSTGVMGQDSTKSSMKTIFGGKIAKYKINYLGIYFAPELQYGQLNSNFVPMGGASMMLQVNKKWGIGLTGFAGRGNGKDADTTKNGGSFGGLKLEYTPKPDAAFHLTFPFMIGVGQQGNGFRGFGEDRGNNERNRFGRGGKEGNNEGFKIGDFERNAYAVVQPGIAVEANLFRYAKVFVGANYRFAFNSDGYSNALQGFSTNAGLKMGIFDYNLKKRGDKKNKKHRHSNE